MTWRDSEAIVLWKKIPVARRACRLSMKVSILIVAATGYSDHIEQSKVAAARQIVWIAAQENHISPESYFFFSSRCFDSALRWYSSSIHLEGLHQAAVYLYC